MLAPYLTATAVRDLTDLSFRQLLAMGSTPQVSMRLIYDLERLMRLCTEVLTEKHCRASQGSSGVVVSSVKHVLYD